MIKQKLLYKTLYIVDVARVSQLMARRMYGIGSRTTENSGPIKLSRQCAMALCRALLTWLFGKSMISKTESKHCSQPCFHRGFYEDQIRPLSAGQKLKFLPLSLTLLVFAAQCAWIFSFVAFFYEKNKTIFAINKKPKEISEQ